MSAQRFVEEVRSALAGVLGTGAVSVGKHTVDTFASLSGRARSLGLDDLACQLEQLSGRLEQRGSLAFEPSLPLADLLLAAHDRVEGLASALQLWSVEQAFATRQPGVAQLDE